MKDQVLLVADDESAVRELVASILRRAGFTVVEAENGLEALGLYSSYRAEFSAIVTDIEMPVMDGLELLDRLTATYGDVRAVVMSGRVTDPELPAHCVFLPKPFGPAALLATIDRALGAGRRQAC